MRPDFRGRLLATAGRGGRCGVARRKRENIGSSKGRIQQRKSFFLHDPSLTFDFFQEDFLRRTLAISLGLFDEFVFDEVSLLMLDETEQLPENHGTNQALKAGGEVGGHTFDGRHGLGRDALVIEMRGDDRVGFIHVEGRDDRGKKSRSSILPHIQNSAEVILREPMVPKARFSATVPIAC